MDRITMSYDPLNKIVRQENGRIIYRTEFGNITTVEPYKGISATDLETARAEIQKADALAHNWRR